ncbi:MAG: two component transcriptional regulator, LuxR family [Pelosinus sp.]|nr:two component transcriptional regulator, LuxR family [Pelosinus sp.]
MNARNYSTKILVVDDDESYLASIRRILRGHVTIITTTDPVQALKIIEYQGPFAVVISDFRMPFMNGIELFSKIIMIDNKIQRIMLTGCAELQMAIDAINRGKITAFLTKPTPAGTIRLVVLDAIRAYNELLAGEQASQLQTNTLSTQENSSGICLPLTVKETEILACLARGYSNGEIAIQLNVTIGTVKSHINNLFGKMGVNSRSKVVAKGMELGLIKTSTPQ